MGKTNFLGSFFISLFLLIICSWGCSSPDKPGDTIPDEDHVNIEFTQHGTLTMMRGGDVFQEIAIEIADTDSSRTRGLMQRDNLPDNSGMLFVFETETEQGFWMANTRLALDLVFIRTDGTVQSITKYVQPMNLDTVPSNGPAQYVLELKAGVVDAIGLTEGDILQWSTLPKE